jgi:hypothetical protein
LTLHLRLDDSRPRHAAQCVCGDPECMRWYEEALPVDWPRTRHIGYWHEGRWRPWCHVDAHLLPEVCADCLALATEELKDEQQ